MEKIDLNQYRLEPLPRPRHCRWPWPPDGRQVFIGYFIMGRSANSRNRVFDPLPERAASAPWQQTSPSWRTPA